MTDPVRAGPVTLVQLPNSTRVIGNAIQSVESYCEALEMTGEWKVRVDKETRLKYHCVYGRWEAWVDRVNPVFDVTDPPPESAPPPTSGS